MEHFFFFMIFRYFTYYAKPIPIDKRINNTQNCYLVGQNLNQACFNLERTCVLMKECQHFNSSCTTCKTGT